MHETVTAALADFEVSATLTTDTVWAPEVEGAVYRPALEMDPTVEFPPAIPSTVQFTAWLVVPVTVAVNCWVAEQAILEDVGLMLTAICWEAGSFAGGCDVLPLPPLPPQRTIRTAKDNANVTSRTRGA